MIPSFVIQRKNIIYAASPAERIAILDSLRGIALLGILLVNIQFFGLPELQVFDVSVKRESGLNFFTWYVFGAGILEGTMRAIFSLLFGAGVILFISRLEEKRKGLIPVAFFFRRQFWLLLFGLFDAYVLLWYGDVLFMYAICGLFLFPFRKLQAKYLFAITVACLFLTTARENLELYKEKAIIKKGQQVAAIDTVKSKLSAGQAQALAVFNDYMKKSTYEEKLRIIQEQKREVLGSYQQMFHSPRILSGERKGLYYYATWDILLFMFLGMAFFKKGILQGEAPVKTYAWMAIGGLSIGLPLSYFYLQPQLFYQHNYFEIALHKRFEFYELQRFVRSIGIFGLIMLLYKSGRLKRVFEFTRPVGQMAFTNYLGQSLLCGLFFYGAGLGMFGKLQRYELYYVVAILWVFQVFISHLWLKHFYYGPAEWLWRSLTYGRRQPFRKAYPNRSSFSSG
jgi:uncharacterized protein